MFQRLWVQIPAPYSGSTFFTYICCKIEMMFVWIIEAGLAHFYTFTITLGNNRLMWTKIRRDLNQEDDFVLLRRQNYAARALAEMMHTRPPKLERLNSWSWEGGGAHPRRESSLAKGITNATESFWWNTLLKHVFFLQLGIVFFVTKWLLICWQHFAVRIGLWLLVPPKNNSHL